MTLCWELAGIVGLDPHKATLRELCDAHAGLAKHQREAARGAWWRTGQLCATIANSVRDPKRRRKPWVAADFVPWGTGSSSSRVRLHAGNIGLLKSLVKK